MHTLKCETLFVSRCKSLSCWVKLSQARLSQVWKRAITIQRSGIKFAKLKLESTEYSVLSSWCILDTKCLPNTAYFLFSFQVSVRYLLLFTSWWPTSLCPPALVSRNSTGVPFSEPEDGSISELRTKKGELWSPRCQNPACVFSASATGQCTWCKIAVLKGSLICTVVDHSLYSW